MRLRAVLMAGACLLLATPALLKPEAPSTSPAPGADIDLPWGGSSVEGRVPPRTTLAALLSSHALDDAVVAAIVEASRRVFDVRRLRADQRYRLVLATDGAVREFVYHIDPERVLRVSRQAGRREADGAVREAFDAEIVIAPREVAVTTIAGSIDRDRPSLVAALAAEGEGVTLALALAEIFGGEIDFNADLQPGDRFQVVFERRLVEGRVAGYGAVLAAEFETDGRVLRAFRFAPGSGEAGYYDEQGRSLKRFFLRSPLRFEPRISSGFSMRRLHPVLGRWRAHPAIDYVAPVGTPVVAVASGVVTTAGWTNGGGKTVTIRHGHGGYESSYLHLSAITVRVGSRVEQGQVIGRVGCTGLCTGPHLDYRLKKHGQWVNPLVEHRRLPLGEPVAAHLRATFERVRAAAEAQFLPPVVAAP